MSGRAQQGTFRVKWDDKMTTVKLSWKCKKTFSLESSQEVSPLAAIKNRLSSSLTEERLQTGAQKSPLGCHRTGFSCSGSTRPHHYNS